jgi:hypothetical protein
MKAIFSPKQPFSGAGFRAKSSSVNGRFLKHHGGKVSAGKARWRQLSDTLTHGRIVVRRLGMEPSSRDRISVDLHGLKATLIERAQALSLSPSHLVRQALADALGRPVLLNTEACRTPAQAQPAARARLCLRMRSEDAVATLQAAQRAGLATGDYVAALVAGVPVILDGRGHAQTLQALNASTGELAHLGRHLYQLNALLRRSDVESIRPYVSVLETLGRDVRRHLDHVSCALADLQPRRPTVSPSVRRAHAATRRSQP